MKQPPRHRQPAAGATLVEAVIGIGVLAVALPVVYGALAEAGKSGFSAEIETRSTWILPACIEEIEASRAGRPRYFTSTQTGQAFPPTGEIWALAFSPDGKPVGKLGRTDYDRGIQTLDGQSIRYIAVLSASPQAVTPAGTVMLKGRITLEHPANAPAAKRGKLDFHTRIP
jgi:hypothetical protein